MNAYELAKYLEDDFQIQEAVIDMLREQADRIKMLEKETSALRKQLIAACNELMEVKR